MFIITLAPLTALPQPGDQLLRYFSKQKVSSGQLVKIELNKRTLFGVAFACTPANEMRIAIKNSPYPLKGISCLMSSAPILSQMHLELALWISSYYYASLGIVLQAMLRPLGIKNTSKKISTSFSSSIGLPGNPIEDEKKRKNSTATFVVGDFSDEIYARFFGAQTLPIGRQILILVPERKDIEIYGKKFREMNPAADVRIFHAGMKLTAQRIIARDALGGVPLVVIGTRSALFLPFQNLATIIVENPSDPSHTSWDQNPHLNAARAAAWLYRHGFVSIMFHEEQPSIELMHYARLNHWDIQISQAKKTSKGMIADMRQELKNGNSSIISERLRKILTTSKKNKEPLFLFVQRRGFASGIVCRDCGFIVMCTSCNVPMVYHDQGTQKFLLCHRCKTRQNAPTLCLSCHGNRIRFIGVGTERVEEETKKLFSDLSVCRLDSDAEHSSEFLAKLRESLAQGTCEYNVIIGTHFAWSIIPAGSMNDGAIITIDGPLSLPDYRSQEHVYGIIEKMKKITRREFIIQTYCPNTPVFSFAIAGSKDAFTKKELALRKILKWPPFVQIVRMQYAHAQASIAQTQAQQGMHLLQTQIQYLGLPGNPRNEDYPAILSQREFLGPSPAFVDKIKNKYVWNIILKWPTDERGEPQNLELRNHLLAVLPHGWNVDVDPIDLV